MFVYDISNATASAVSRVIIYFGQGNSTGLIATFHSRYNDTVVKENEFYMIAVRPYVPHVNSYLTELDLSFPEKSLEIRLPHFHGAI